MTRAEFTAITVAAGLLLVGYGADLAAHWYSRVPSSRYALADSIFFQLAAGMDTVSGRRDTTASPRKLDTEKSDMMSVPSSSASSGRVLVDLNHATRSQLIDLPGIGPALAERIIRSREKDGPFGSVADLERISGIGPAKLARLRHLVTVGQADDPS